VSNRPAASIGVNHLQAPEVPTPGLGAARAIADRTDRHARRGLAIVFAFSRWLMAIMVHS
jgi:hypothetical protein